jgi:dTDP-4-dehydrorhamnose 3,5-epimerase
MSRFEIQNLPLAGLKRVTRKAHSDARGFISRIFCDAELAEAGWHGPIRQINHARTVRSGALRGMHYQRPPHCEMKLVSCIRGEVWDVAVDVRAGSPTFLKWHAERLSEDNQHALLIPEGFAHGFQAITDNVELLYCHSAAYIPDHEAALNPLDPRLGIAWPLPVTEMSERDRNYPMLSDFFKGVAL